MTFVFAKAVAMIGVAGSAGLLVLFPFLMAYAGSRDLLTMLIPNWVSLALVAGFAPLALVAGFDPWEFGTHVAAGLIVLGVTFSLFASGAIGGGDAKLAAATAIWMGLGHTLDYLLVASVLGGVLTLMIIAARSYPLPVIIARLPFVTHLHDAKTGIPYGIALSAAGLLVLPQTLLWARLVGPA